MHYYANCRKWSFLRIMHDISYLILWKATMPYELFVCWTYVDVSNSSSYLVNMACPKCSTLLKTGKLALLLIWRQAKSQKMSADAPAGGLLVHLISSPPYHFYIPLMWLPIAAIFSSVLFSSCQNSRVGFRDMGLYTVDFFTLKTRAFWLKKTSDLRKKIRPRRAIFRVFAQKEVCANENNRYRRSNRLQIGANWLDGIMKMESFQNENTPPIDTQIVLVQFNWRKYLGLCISNKKLVQTNFIKWIIKLFYW